MKRIIMFGAGMISRTLLKYDIQEGIEVLFICDNNRDLWGDRIGEVLIVSPDKIKETDFDILLLCFIDGNSLCSVYDQVLKMGVDSEKIMFSYSADTLGYSWSPLEDLFIIPPKATLPFERRPALVSNEYKGESARCHERREKEGFFDKYCKGEGLDIGYGSDPIVPDVYGWDAENGDAQFLHGVEDESLDYVYSSHCLEHLWDVRTAIHNWFRVLKRGAILLSPFRRETYMKRRKHCHLVGMVITNICFCWGDQSYQTHWIL